MTGWVRAARAAAAGGGVVADPLDVKQAPAGGEADLLQFGEMRQPFGHAEVFRVIDRGFRSQRLAQLVVLLDFGVLVVHVQARGHPVGDDAGAEPARRGPPAFPDDPAVEDQRGPGPGPGCRGTADRRRSARSPGPPASGARRTPPAAPTAHSGTRPRCPPRVNGYGSIASSRAASAYVKLRNAVTCGHLQLMSNIQLAVRERGPVPEHDPKQRRPPRPAGGGASVEFEAELIRRSWSRPGCGTSRGDGQGHTPEQADG